MRSPHRRLAPRAVLASVFLAAFTPACAPPPQVLARTFEPQADVPISLRRVTYRADQTEIALAGPGLETLDRSRSYLDVDGLAYRPLAESTEANDALTFDLGRRLATDATLVLVLDNDELRLIVPPSPGAG